MKSYGQLCAVARALDVIGDRWTLLIVRELLISGPLRFGEIQRGLPGVATNLLTQRLRDLEAHGVVARGSAPGSGTPSVYRLTERGRALDPVLRELLRWGAPTVPAAPADAAFQMHWLSQPARFLLTDRRPDDGAVRLRFGTPGEGFDAVADGGAVTVGPCDRDAEADATITGPGQVLVGMVQGAIDLTAAMSHGVEVTGDVDALRRVLPG